ncbi:MAG TPA: PKD domain-containing protein, partial [Nitrospiraceae bacterium]
MASPVDILVQDFLGRRIGFNPSTGIVVNDFGPLGFYSGPGTEPQTIYIGGALPGPHIVTGIGTGSGPYTLTVTRRDLDGNVLQTQTTTGVASSNAAIAPLSTIVPGSLPGDPNGDGIVNQADLNILSLDLGKTMEQSACGFLCDLDFDGMITSLDAQLLQLIYNRSPIAHVGPDQSVNEGTNVTLDGSGSTDPQGLPLQFTWSQVSGPPVTLNLSDPVHPTFLAPTVPASGATLSFQLTVSDGPLTGTATVNVTVKHVNHPPVALAGPDQAVAEASLVTLDGSASYDPDADALTYLWSQTGGPSVTLTDATVAKPLFLAPLVGSAGTTLGFELTVTDTSGSNASATAQVDVTNVNHPPVANAGLDQTRNAGAMIQLDGMASSDPDNDPLTFTWSQLSGPGVTLSDIHSATPTFVSPQVSSLTTLTFQLVVDDGFGSTASADVHITLLPVDAPPVCTHARAHPALLWPPDHRLAEVRIKSVTDPDDQKVKLTVTQVTQDEPQGCTTRHRSRDYDADDDEAHGCRHTTPDAIMHRHGHVLIRAERRDHGNGRVYQITFQATDGQGGQCTGQV